MKTSVLYVVNYHTKESVKDFFRNNYAVFIDGHYYPTMNYRVSDDYCDGYRVEFTADNKDTAYILEAVSRLNKSVYECKGVKCLCILSRLLTTARLFLLLITDVWFTTLVVYPVRYISLIRGLRYDSY